MIKFETIRKNTRLTDYNDIKENVMSVIVGAKKVANIRLDKPKEKEKDNLLGYYF